MKVDVNGTPIETRPDEVITGRNSSLRLEDGYVQLDVLCGDSAVIEEYDELVNIHKALGLAIEYGWLKKPEIVPVGVDKE